MTVTVLFDLDGTLANTAADITAAANAMLRDLSLRELSAADAESYIGDGMKRFVKRALTGQRRGEPAAELLQQAQARMSFHYARECTVNRGGVYPGVCDTLAELQRCGARLACVTNKPGQFVSPVLSACGLDSFFAAVVAGDSLATKKPDPAPLQEACRQLQTPCAEAWMVGDSPADAAAAAAAGCGFVGVGYGYHGVDNFGKTIVYNFAELLPIVMGEK